MEELSYQFRQPEADDFNKYMLAKDYKSARLMLKQEKISPKNIDIIINTIIERNSVMYDLVEISVDECKEGESYIFRVGNHIEHTTVYYLGSSLKFHLNSNFVDLKEAQQVWKKVVKP